MLCHCTHLSTSASVAFRGTVILTSSPFFLNPCDLTVVTSIVCLVYMPETLGKTLQEIDEIWDARIDTAKSLIRRLVPKKRMVDAIPLEELTLA